MRADAVSVLGLFFEKLRLEVPLFQRQYVWKREQQWEPLWEDIARKFTEYVEGRKDRPVHFLGAMVLDQKLTPVTHVSKRQVIDGQQRLTTLQIFLSAFRDFSRESGADALAAECEQYTLNRGMMADPGVDRFKVWPTQLDRPQFTDVISAGSRAAVEKLHPLKRRKHARKPDPRPPMVEAYIFFHDRLQEYFFGHNGDAPLAAEVPIAGRLEECFGALKNALQVVVIDLEAGDDAQVIFETLNARGEPLLPADLLRNFVFLRAARRGEAQEHLYRNYWARFDDPFWRKEVKQGRLLRPRSDLFLQHFLASRQTVDIPIKHLFVEYKYWLEREQPFQTVAEELATLAKQGEDFRRLLEPKPDDVLRDLAAFLDAFDISTAYPLLLAFLDVQVSDAELSVASKSLESYLLRRAVCNLTTKNYNRIFLQITRALRKDGMTSANLAAQLKGLTGESGEWPSDAAFKEAWRTKHAYQVLNNPKIVYILRRLNETYFGSKTEVVHIRSPLTVEHLMPQLWQEHWPLADGAKGLTAIELLSAAEGDGRAAATRRRGDILQTLGNLTILTQGLNSAVSNGPWSNKRPEIMRHSLLPLNQQLSGAEVWDETTISQRADALFERAVALWPGASSSLG